MANNPAAASSSAAERLDAGPMHEAGVTIDIAVEAGAWPAAAELRVVAEQAVDAALAELASEGALRPPQTPRSEEEHGGGLADLSDPSLLRVLESGAELSIVFTDDTAIRSLNRAWRGKNKATNVLSFPQSTGPLMGDIILAYGTVNGEAALAGRALQAHMAHLIIHGFLHLLGHDHETDAEAASMEAIESAALARMGIADPYAAAREP